MLWTFDDMAGYQSLGERELFMGAAAVSGIELSVGRMVQRVDSAAMDEAAHILPLDVVGAAGVDPTHALISAATAVVAPGRLDPGSGRRTWSVGSFDKRISAGIISR